MSAIRVIREVRNPQGVMVPLIDVESLRSMLEKAKKTKPILAIQASVALAHGVHELVEIVSLEGNEKIDRLDSWITRGIDGEPWVQSDGGVLKGYNFVGLDPKNPAWLIFEPKPEDERLTVLVNQFSNGFAIYGRWGMDPSHQDETFPDGEKRFLQFSYGNTSFAVTREDSPMDWWLVEPTIYNRSYEWL